MRRREARKNLSWLLVKNRLIAQLGLNVFRYETDKHKRHGKIALAAVIVFCLVLFAGYCAAMAYGYASLGLTELIPGIAMVISSLVTLFFTMFKAHGEFFGFKDYDLVMSLPIPVRTVINSRFLNMYIWNAFITFLIMLPMGIVYAAFAQPSFGFYLMWLAGILLICLIPTTLAAVFGAVITAISAKFRYASAISTILSIGFVVMLLLLSMSATAGGPGLGQIIDPQTGDIDPRAFSALAPVISAGLNKLYPPAALFTDAIVKGNFLAFLLFAGISLGWYALFVFLLSLKYRQINTAITSRQSRGDYRLAILHQGSMLSALYKKTVMRILKSTVCATNLLIGCVLAILMAAAMLVAGPEQVLKSLELADYLSVVKNVAPFVIAAMVTMSNTAAISLALEGRNVWLVQSLPIPPKILYDSYLLTNLTFTVPTSLLCSILIGMALQTGLLGTALLILTPLAFALFAAAAGVFIGNRMAYYDWQDETRLVKQSLMSMIAMLGGILLVMVCGAIANSGVLPVAPALFTIMLDALLLILAAAIYIREGDRPIRQ